MSYPSRNEIISCVEIPALISDSVINTGIMVNKNNGEAKVWAGGFSMVFQFDVDGELWAFKVWHSPMDSMRTRYSYLKKTLGLLNSPYFVEFEYMEGGLFTGEFAIDTSRMRWVEGVTLDVFISQNIQDSDALRDVANNFRAMVNWFHCAGVAHGDLQHGNILVLSNRELVVIDYDSMFVEGMASMPDLINGLGGYQHPSRVLNEQSCANMDYFSELVIYLSLLVYAVRPELWDEGTDWLLFSKQDLLTPESSQILTDLRAFDDPMIRHLAEALFEFLKLANINSIVSLEEILACSARISKPILSSITSKF